MTRYFATATLLAVSFTAAQASAVSLIGAGIGAGNGDFNYEGGATGIPGTVSLNENIPRDRVLASIGGNPGQGIDGTEWTILRVAYNGGNSAIGWDGNFGFDDAGFEPANTGSGQAFINGNENSVADLIADQIAYAGSAGDVLDLSYLLGSDSTGGTALVTLTLDEGLGSEQSTTFSLQTRAGTLRDGSNTITEQYVATADYTTVDLTIRMNNVVGSTRTLIDDVRLDVTPVPEPSSLALIGLAGLLVARRRRG